MNALLKNERGVTFISALISGVIIILSIGAYLIAQDRANKNRSMFRQKYMAKLHAVELEEFFRAFNSTEAILKGYMGTTIPFCTKINFMDRSNNGAIAKPDTVANMPSTFLDGNSASTKANRYYQIDIADITKDPPQVNQSYCASGAPTGAAATPSDQERALVTVWVSWIPPGKTLSEEQSVQVKGAVPGL